MPKNKTHSGTKKRFRLTGSGKVMREQANRRHLFEGKPSTRTRASPSTSRPRARTSRRSSACSGSSRRPVSPPGDRLRSTRHGSPQQRIPKENKQWHA